MTQRTRGWIVALWGVSFGVNSCGTFGALALNHPLRATASAVVATAAVAVIVHLVNGFPDTDGGGS